MSANNSEPYYLNQQVSFVQHALPGLDAGQYELQVQQQVFPDVGDTPISGNAYTNAYTFAVTADRFRLTKPSSVVSSLFPNDNASGEFTTVLPHVVFKKPTFPWMRYPTVDPPYATPETGQDVDVDVPTWLWIMLLDEDDPIRQTITTCTTGDLFPTAAYPGSQLPANTYSYFYTATGLQGLEPGQLTSDPVNVIDVPASLFWQLAPSVNDLALLAHVRVVSLINQPTDNDSNGEPTGTFSIVFGNRLPQTQRKTTAYLVSLEGLQAFLPQADGAAPADPPCQPADAIRLAVLASWSFFSTGQSASFVHQLESLNGCTPGSGVSATNTNIRLPYTGNPVVESAFNMGYVPLNETLRTAEQNVAWYRGPLLPYAKGGMQPLQSPIPSPDAATLFDPTTGLLDTSYAAAWTIGRMVALQDTAFSSSLYNWKKGLQQQVLNNIEIKLLIDHFGLQADGGEAVLTPALSPGSILKQTALKLKS